MWGRGEVQDGGAEQGISLRRGNVQGERGLGAGRVGCVNLC